MARKFWGSYYLYTGEYILHYIRHIANYKTTCMLKKKRIKTQTNYINERLWIR